MKSIFVSQKIIDQFTQDLRSVDYDNGDPGNSQHYNYTKCFFDAVTKYTETRYPATDLSTVLKSVEYNDAHERRDTYPINVFVTPGKFKTITLDLQSLNLVVWRGYRSSLDSNIRDDHNSLMFPICNDTTFERFMIVINFSLPGSLSHDIKNDTRTPCITDFETLLKRCSRKSWCVYDVFKIYLCTGVPELPEQFLLKKKKDNLVSMQKELLEEKTRILRLEQELEECRTKLTETCELFSKSLAVSVTDSKKLNTFEEISHVLASEIGKCQQIENEEKEQCCRALEVKRKKMEKLSKKPCETKCVESLVAPVDHKTEKSYEACRVESLVAPVDHKTEKSHEVCRVESLVAPVEQRTKACPECNFLNPVKCQECEMCSTSL